SRRSSTTVAGGCSTATGISWIRGRSSSRYAAWRRPVGARSVSAGSGSSHWAWRSWLSACSGLTTFEGAGTSILAAVTRGTRNWDLRTWDLRPIWIGVAVMLLIGLAAESWAPYRIIDDQQAVAVDY